MILSCVIPASQKDVDSQNLKDLISTINGQIFDGEVEILVITEGDSESAKAIGIRRAKGDIVCMLCADNYLNYPFVFSTVARAFERNPDLTGVYSERYSVLGDRNSLNRYFSLIGGNDPICYYLGKNDRKPHWELESGRESSTILFFDKVPSLGDNGFFYRRSHLLEADLDNYYPMDCAVDLVRKGRRVFMRLGFSYIWHRTSDSIISFLKKRYRYARDLFCERRNRRWKIIDTDEDKRRLVWFIVATVTIIPALALSIRGFIKTRDRACFWHWPVCAGFLITYTLLAIRNLFKHGLLFQCPQSQSLSQPLAV